MLSINEFSYHLPNEQIAKYPLPHRDQSKLLIYNKGQICEGVFSEIHQFLPDNCLLCFNDTKVIKARIIFQKSSGSPIEIFCLEPSQPTNYHEIFEKQGNCQWLCLVGNLKKWKDEILSKTIKVNETETLIEARLVERNNQYQVVEFVWKPGYLTFGTILESIGKIPIPPYLQRDSEELDNIRYQTIFSTIQGSVAAPTAGLHFTDKVICALRNKNIELTNITLHVSAGTFRPVKETNILKHQMHTEHFYFNISALENLKRYYGNITAVGTTTLRALESIYWLGIKLMHSSNNINLILEQWDWQHLPIISAEEVLHYLINYCKHYHIHMFEAKTQLMIVPGYPFKMVNCLITNFHQPQSTLLLLVAAFVGVDKWKPIYDYALTHQFRFLSYGDSSLLMP